MSFVLGVLIFLWIAWDGVSTGTRLSVVLPVAAGFGVVAFTVVCLIVRALGWLGNDRRRLTVAALSVFAAMGLFPPWVYTFSAPGMATSTKSAGYHSILRPPAPEDETPYYGIQIDILRLAIQYAVVAAVAGALITLQRGPLERSRVAISPEDDRQTPTQRDSSGLQGLVGATPLRRGPQARSSAGSPASGRGGA